MPDLRQRILAEAGGSRQLSRSVCAGPNPGGMAGGAHPRRIRRRGGRAGRSVRHPRRDQSVWGKLRRLSRADVYDGGVVATWLAGTEAPLPAPDCLRRLAPPIIRGDRADQRHRHDQNQDLRRTARRHLRRQRAEGVHLTSPALGLDAAAGPDDAPGRGHEEDRRVVSLPRGLAREQAKGADGPAHPQHGQPRDQRAVFRPLRGPRGESDR